MHSLQFDVKTPTQSVLSCGLAEGQAGGNYLLPQQAFTSYAAGELMMSGAGATQVVIAAPANRRKIRLFRYHICANLYPVAGFHDDRVVVEWTNGVFIFSHIICQENTGAGMWQPWLQLEKTIDFSPYGIEGAMNVGVQLRTVRASFDISWNFLYSQSI